MRDKRRRKNFTSTKTLHTALQTATCAQLRFTTAPSENTVRPHELIASPDRILEATEPGPNLERFVLTLKPSMYATVEVTLAVPPAVAVARDQNALHDRE